MFDVMQNKNQRKSHMPHFAFPKAVFGTLKGRLWQGERRPFATTKVTRWFSSTCKRANISRQNSWQRPSKRIVSAVQTMRLNGGNDISAATKGTQYTLQPATIKETQTAYHIKMYLSFCDVKLLRYLCSERQ